MQNKILNSLGPYFCVLTSSKAAILTAEHTVPLLVFCPFAFCRACLSHRTLIRTIESALNRCSVQRGYQML